MLNPVSSPGDPIFFLHHAWLDWLWAKWQAQDPSARLRDIAGNNRGVLGGVFGGPSSPGFGVGPPPGGGGAGGGAGIPTIPGGGSFTPANLTRPEYVP